MPNISVIIPTLNRSELLRKTIHSILSHDANNIQYEIIVIDNGSTDQTQDVVNSLKENENIRYYFVPEIGLHNGRHKGLEKARNDILVFCDDDIQVSDKWLQGINKGFKNDNVVLVGGSNYPNFEIQPPTWIQQYWQIAHEGKYMLQLSISDLGDKPKKISPYLIWGCNFAIRKEFLESIKGFHPDGFPKRLIQYRGDGESYVANEVIKRGFSAYYHPLASINHFVSKERMTTEYFYQRGYSEGITTSYKLMRDSVKSKERLLKRLLTKSRKYFQYYRNQNNEYEKGFYRGYKYHQKQMKINESLIKWVSKDDYLGPDEEIIQELK